MTKINYLSDLIAKYKGLVTQAEIDYIVSDIERERPYLYKCDPVHYLQRVELDINIYIGNKEQKRTR